MCVPQVAYLHLWLQLSNSCNWSGRPPLWWLLGLIHRLANLQVSDFEELPPVTASNTSLLLGTWGSGDPCPSTATVRELVRDVVSLPQWKELPLLFVPVQRVYFLWVDFSSHALYQLLINSKAFLVWWLCVFRQVLLVHCITISQLLKSVLTELLSSKIVQMKHTQC